MNDFFQNSIEVEFKLAYLIFFDGTILISIIIFIFNFAKSHYSLSGKDAKSTEYSKRNFVSMKMLIVQQVMFCSRCF
jgi:hypothetical protein